MKEGPHFLGIPMPIGFRYRVYEKPYPTEEERQRWKRKSMKDDLIFLILLLGAGELYDYYYKTDTPFLKAPKFTPFSIVGKEEVSPTSFIVTLRPKSYIDKPRLAAKSDPYKKEWEKGTWSVEFKQPELQIARSYTPLPPRQDDKPGDLRFLIREEANGEMSRYLARLGEGDKVELRGPHTELELPSEVTDVLFLAGGTGIAPALQVAHTLLEVRKLSQELPNIHIVWANRRREDCLGGTELQPAGATERVEGAIVQELRKLQDKYPDNVRVDYFVDDEGKFVDQGTISQLTRRQSDLTHQAVSTRIDSKLLFVSGPEGFVNFLAGPKKYWGGKEVQGDLGGLIGKMGIRDWKVWKQ